MSDPAVAELRRYLNQVIAILQPYALSSGALNKQNAETAIHLAAAERTLTREMLIAWHQQRASDCFDLVARVTHMPKVDADAVKATAQFHIEAARLLQALRSEGQK